MIAATHEAVELTHEGNLTLCQMERNGILIDTDYLDRAIKKTKRKIRIMTEELLEDDVFKKTWRKRFGSGAKLGSKQQLEKVVFEDLGFERKGYVTGTGQHKADKNAFELVEHPFVKKFFKLEEWKKVDSTYLPQLNRETLRTGKGKGWMHPIANLHTAITYRPSYDKPNVANFPIRVLEMARMTRRAFIAPDGYRIVEVDLSGAEVCGSACYHKDPKMIEYILDPTTDMHRDMAMECYKLKLGKEKYWKGDGKMVRYCTKNRFVFPEFYGSFYRDCARDLWEAIDLFDLKANDGTPLKKHLKKKGIKERGACGDKEKPVSGTFEYHIQQVEKKFWEERFTVYDEWKDDWWKQYVKRGWFPFLSGFVSQGLYRYNQVVNSPIQGDSFHFLLWAMIQLQKWMNKKKLKSKIIFQIYDSLVMYLHEKEIDLVLEKYHEIVTKRLREHWKWIIVPLKIDADVAPKGGSWFDKQKYEIAA